MSAKWRTVRVFVSSTFRDMHAERDYLVKRVFPKLRERLERYRVYFDDVDLRWGVPEEQADDGRALELCLDQVEQCHPFLIAILGERSGALAKTLPEQVASKFPWIKEFVGRSITELEIRLGVRAKGGQPARPLFFFRDASFVHDVPIQKRADVESENALALELVASLKRAVNKATLPVPPTTYHCHYRGLRIDPQLKRQLKPALWQSISRIIDCGVVLKEACDNADEDVRNTVLQHGYIYVAGLEDFGKQVYDQLWDQIKAVLDLEAPTVSDPLQDEETGYHERFMECRLRTHVGRKDIDQHLMVFSASDSIVPCLVTGPPGQGKSTTLARFVTTYRENNRTHFVIAHFIGASAASTNLIKMLRRFCHIIDSRLGLDEQVPHDFAHLTSHLRNSVQQIPDELPTLIVLDALDQLDAPRDSRNLFWLPPTLPSHVKIVISAANDKDDMAVLGSRSFHRIDLPALTDEERLAIVRTVPSLSAKTLDTQQVKMLLENPATKNPLFLSVALEELRSFGRYELLNARIRDLPCGSDAITDLFCQMIEGLEYDFGKTLTHSVLTKIAVSRGGLSEAELKELTEETNTGDEIFGLLRQLRAHLHRRGPLLDFYHRNLLKAVRRAYLGDIDSCPAVHRELAVYYSRKLNPPGKAAWSGECPRALLDLPFHQVRGEEWQKLEETLTDLRFVSAKCEAGMTFDLLADYEVAGVALCEHSNLAMRINEQRQVMLRRYGEQLIAYARAEKADQTLPMAPDSTVPLRRAAENGVVNDVEDHQRIDNVERFAAPIKKYAHVIQRCSGIKQKLTLPILRNHAASGRVVEQAEKLLRDYTHAWLSRDPRPPALPLMLSNMKTLTHGNEPIGLSVAITSDGCMAVSACDVKMLYVRDLQNGRLKGTLEGHDGWVTGVASTPDGTMAVSSSDDKTVRVWDVRTGSLKKTLAGHTAGVKSVAITPDGRIAASASDDKTVRIWDVELGTGHAAKVISVAITPDGRTVVSGSHDETVRVWDVRTGHCAKSLVGDNTCPVMSVSITPDGRRAISTGLGTVHVWNVQTGELEGTLDGHFGAVLCVAMTPDGKMGISAGGSLFGGDAALRIWDLQTGQLVRTLEGHADLVNGVAITPDGQTAVSVSNDRTLRVWNLASEQPERFIEAHSDRVAAIAITPDKRKVVTGSFDATLRVWDVQTGQIEHTLEGHDAFVQAVAIAPDGETAVSASLDHTLCVWELRTGRRVCVLEGHARSVNNLAIAKNGSTLVSTSADKTIGVWNLQTGRRVKTMEGHNDSHDSVLITPDGMIAVSSGDFTLSVWDLQRCLQKNTIHAHEPFRINAIAMAPDGRFVVSIGADTLRIWSLSEGRLLKTCKGHERPIQAVALTPDGKFAVSAGCYEPIRIWETETGRLEKVLRGDTALTSALAVTPNGNMAVSADENGVCFWNIVTGEQVAVYPTESECKALAVVSDTRVVVGTMSGQVDFLTLRNLRNASNDRSAR